MVKYDCYHTHVVGSFFAVDTLELRTHSLTFDEEIHSSEVSHFDFFTRVKDEGLSVGICTSPRTTIIPPNTLKTLIPKPKTLAELTHRSLTPWERFMSKHKVQLYALHSLTHSFIRSHVCSRRLQTPSLLMQYRCETEFKRCTIVTGSHEASYPPPSIPGESSPLPSLLFGDRHPPHTGKRFTQGCFAVPHVGSLPFGGTRVFSIEAWVKPSNLSGNGMVIAKYDSSSQQGDFWLRLKV